MYPALAPVGNWMIEVPSAAALPLSAGTLTVVREQLMGLGAFEDIIAWGTESY
jgi:hypothetical protein